MDTNISSGNLIPPVLQFFTANGKKRKEIVAISFRPWYNTSNPMAVGCTVTAGGQLALGRLAGFYFMSVKKEKFEINHNNNRGTRKSSEFQHPLTGKENYHEKLFCPKQENVDWYRLWYPGSRVHRWHGSAGAVWQ